MEKKLEAYIDVMLVKNISFEQHLKDIEEVFVMLRNYRIKLNQTKCLFSIKARKFLRFMISKNRIKPNLEKLKTLTVMNPPRTLKEEQELTGR